MLLVGVRQSTEETQCSVWSSLSLFNNGIDHQQSPGEQ